MEKEAQTKNSVLESLPQGKISQIFFQTKILILKATFYFLTNLIFSYQIQWLVLFLDSSVNNERHCCVQYPTTSMESGFQDIKNNWSLTSTQHISSSECKNLNCFIQHRLIKLVPLLIENSLLGRKIICFENKISPVLNYVTEQLIMIFTLCYVTGKTA